MDTEKVTGGVIGSYFCESKVAHTITVNDEDYKSIIINSVLILVGVYRYIKYF